MRGNWIVAAVILFGSWRAPVRAENWPGWRGPTGYGVTEEKELPLKWDAKSGEGVVWKASLKDLTGHSSPVVWGDKVFLTTADKQTNAQEKAKEIPGHYLNCYQAADGKLLWSTKIEGGKEAAGYAIYAVPTPVTDGKLVYAWFGSAVIVAVDFDGKVVWRQEREGPFNLNPGITSSPILYKDTVVLLCDEGRGIGWLQALDKKTGEVKWEQKRKKTGTSNTTPVIVNVNGKDEMLVSAAESMQGLDPTNGEPIWWCKAQGFGASPAYGGGVVFCDAGNGGAGVAVDPTGTGDVTATHVKWKLPKVAAQYGSPVIFGDWVYRANKNTITCWDVKSGEQVFSENAEGLANMSSPIVTPDGRIYFCGGDKSYVIKAGPKLEVLATNDLKCGSNGSSAAVSDGRIFIRGNDAFFCVGKK